MLTSSDGFGFGFKSIGRGFKKIGKGAVKGVKTVGKGAKAVGKGTVRGGKVVGKGVVKGAKVTGKVAVKGVKTVGKIAVLPAKFAFNLAMRPVRSRLSTLKNRRAKKISWDRRKSKLPSAAEKAEARRWLRKDLKKKGPHGKLLSVLAGSPPLSGPFGELGEPVSATLVAAVPVLVVLLDNMIKAYSKSDAPAQPEAAPESDTTTPATEEDAQDDATAAAVAQEIETLPKTETEVTEAPEEQVEAEETTTEEMNEAMDPEVAKGLLSVADIAIYPSGASTDVARKLAGAAQRIVCSLSPSTLNAIGGPDAMNVAGTFCHAAKSGNADAAREALPGVLQIASMIAAQHVVTLQHDPEPFVFGEVLDLTPQTRQDLGMLSVLHGVDEESLARAFDGVSLPENLPSAALLPALVAVAAGFWMAFHK